MANRAPFSVTFELGQAIRPGLDRAVVKGCDIEIILGERDPELPRPNGYAIVKRQSLVEAALLQWDAIGRPSPCTFEMTPDGLKVAIK